MKTILLLLLLASASLLQADALVYTFTGTSGKPQEGSLTLTPSTTLRVSAGGAVEVLSSADFRTAIGLGDAAEKNVGTTAGTVAEGDDARIIAGGTALQPAGDGSGLGEMTKAQVGLSNVDNTSDATKDATTATLTNKTLTSPVINTPTGLVKGDVGLGNVDNTSDADKPVSTAGQTALDLKLDDSQASSFGLTLLDDADATAGRATLGLVIGTNVLAPAGDGSALTGLIWSQIGSTPTTLSGYGITDAVGTGGSRADLTGGSGSLDLAAFTLGLPADVTRLGSSIDLASEVTGTLPGSAVQTSATGNAGVTTEATDGEVQAGTGVKNVVVSSLAAWWTWIRAQAWSWSGAQTFTGNTTLGDASGDTVTINAGTVTAANATDVSSNRLANVGALDNRYDYMAGNRYLEIDLHNFTTAMLTAVGGAASPSITTGAVDVPAWVYRPLNTTDGAANYQALLGPYNNLSASPKSRSTKNWSKATVLSVRFQHPVVSAGTLRYYLGPQASTWAGGSLAVKGIGFEIVANSLFAVCHDGTTKTTAGSGVAMTTSTQNIIVIASDGAGGARWWVNGAEQTALSGGPTGDSAGSQYGFCTEAVNPTPATATFISIQHINIKSAL